METISLPTNATWRSVPGARVARARPAAASSRANAWSSLRRHARGQPSGQAGDGRGRLGQRPRAELLDVDARRAEARALGQGGVAHRRPQALGGVARADEHGPRPGQALARGGQEALGVALDGVLQRAAVDLHGVGHVAAERAGEDQRPHDEVVGQRHVGPRAGDDVADGGHVGLDVGGDLGVAALGERAGRHALVAVGDVDGQEVADVGPPGRHAHRLAQDLDARRAALPGADGVDERELLGPAVLAEQVDDRSAARQRGREPCVVDVRAGPAQQVAVEDEDAHRRGESSDATVRGACPVSSRPWPSATACAPRRPAAR